MKLTKKQLKEMVREEVLKETTLRNRSIRLDRVIREREVLRRIQEKYDENFGANSLKTDLAINMDLLDDAKGIIKMTTRKNQFGLRGDVDWHSHVEYELEKQLEKIANIIFKQPKSKPERQRIIDYFEKERLVLRKKIADKKDGNRY